VWLGTEELLAIHDPRALNVSLVSLRDLTHALLYQLYDNQVGAAGGFLWVRDLTSRFIQTYLMDDLLLLLGSSRAPRAGRLRRRGRQIGM